MPSSTSPTADTDTAVASELVSEVRAGPGLLERFGGVGILAAIFLACVLTLPGEFLEVGNITAVANDQSVTFILTLGVVTVLACGVFDISVAGTMSLAVMFCANVFESSSGNAPVILVILGAIAIGALCGVINALLVVRMDVDPFIATLGTGSVFLGISNLIGGGKIVSENIPEAFLSLGQDDLLGVPLPVWYAAALGIVLWYVLALTPLGRLIYATGQGREAATLSGVPTGRLLTLVFILSGIAAAIAGVVFTARIGAGQPNVGNAYLLPIYAAAFLGSTIISPGRFNVPGTLVATLIVAFGINGLQLHGVESWVNDVFVGGALVLAVVISRLTRNRIRT